MPFPKPRPIRRRGHARFAALVLCACMGWPAAAYGQAACADVLAEAERQYREAEYRAAAGLLDTCLREGDDPDEVRVEAYRLLALALLRLDDLPGARGAVLNLLQLAPDYETDAFADPPAYVALVDLVKQQLALPEEPPPEDVVTAEPEETVEEPPDPLTEPPIRQRRRWRYVLGGGLIAGAAVAAAVLLGGGGTGGEPLPLPPAFP